MRNSAILDLSSLEQNLRQLEKNVSRLLKRRTSAVRQALCEKCQDVVWRVNRPISILNDYVARALHCPTRKTKKEVKSTELQVSLMESEGPLPQ